MRNEEKGLQTDCKTRLGFIFLSLPQPEGLKSVMKISFCWVVYSILKTHHVTYALIMTSSSAGNTNLKWNAMNIRELVQKRFQKQACWFQIQIAIALYEGRDVVGIASTGVGKTLSFWIPLLMALAP